MAQTTRLDIRNQRTEQVIERINGEIERWTLDQVKEMGATHRTRQVAEKAFKKIILGRKYLVMPKHSVEERFFLRLMIMFALARRPNLHSKANDVADYFSSNYAFEWTQSPINRSAMLRSRDMILSSAESEFGETPMAAPLAYVYHHGNTLPGSVTHGGRRWSATGTSSTRSRPGANASACIPSRTNEAVAVSQLRARSPRS